MNSKIEKYYILDNGHGIEESFFNWLEKNPNIQIINLSFEFNNHAILIYYKS